MRVVPSSVRVQVGSSEIGFVKVGLAEVSAADVRLAEVGPAKIGLAGIDMGKVNRSWKGACSVLLQTGALERQHPEMIRGLACGYFSLARSRILSISASFIDSRPNAPENDCIHPARCTSSRTCPTD
jgi:hypothetical protein